jgi:AP2 domain./HNH endonuclease.
MAIVEIPLTRGYVATIDDSDLELVEPHKWHAQRGRRTWYAVRQIGGRGNIITILMHRVILGITDSNIECDHRDGNGLNNQRSNLRPATKSQNRRNQAKHAGCSSRFKGVSFQRRNTHRPWVATIGYGTPVVTTYLGAFATEEDAAHAYDRAALQLFGEFARLNFPVM